MSMKSRLYDIYADGRKVASMVVRATGSKEAEKKVREKLGDLTLPEDSDIKLYWIS